MRVLQKRSCTDDANVRQIIINLKRSGAARSHQICRKFYGKFKTQFFGVNMAD
ncbi:hypothetical protein CAMGR0001_2789 [Campylobacter gracilis RM3268]|uniref:Uncharacterized protein n=1 Tax=Campylobacter gracilis RM3268 TaxID=553220 RepID=C8PKZ9_9BACT|nr:hypothetical protein CAMGR0001_2789 [Campylobacter gracilis RM3268]